MVISGSTEAALEVKYIDKCIIKAAEPPSEPTLLPLSNFDLLSGRFPVSVYYAYPNPNSIHFASIVASLKASLSKVLIHYYPFAGRIVPGPVDDEPLISCDNQGVEFTEAEANLPLSGINLHDLNASLQKNLLPVSHVSPLCVQVTSYTCGGFSVGMSFDHVVADAHGFTMFLVAWSEMALTGSVSVEPDHERLEMFLPRSPLSYGPEIDRMLTSCRLEEIMNMPTNDISIKRLYLIERSDVERLQELCAEEGRKGTKIEAFSAYLWKIMATTVESEEEECKMGWLVDGRTRLGNLSNYVGNVVSMALGEARVQDLKREALQEVAGRVHQAIDKVTNKDHFLDLIDWIECKRPGLVLAKILLGRGGRAVMVSSGLRAAVGEVDLGYGGPVVGTCYSLIPRLGAGYVNPQPSGRGDGSWVVFAILWPALAEALESDPDHVFRPMTLQAHLG